MFMLSVFVWIKTYTKNVTAIKCSRTRIYLGTSDSCDSEYRYSLGIDIVNIA